MNETFGSLIKRLREEKNMDMKEFSQKSGLTMVELKNIETGSNYPQFYSLKKLADALECDCNLLYDKLVEIKRR